MSSIRKPLCKVVAVAGGLELVKKLTEKAHHKFDIVYEGYLANHLPHALYTLCALGASLDRVQEYYDHYVKRLEPLRPLQFKITASNWEDHIGKTKAYSEFLQFFDEQVIEHGLEGVFSRYFPRLMGCSFGAALHPLIHIGYAMEYSGVQWVLAEGLSYACTYPLQGSNSFLELDHQAEAPENLASVLELIAELQELDFPHLTRDIGTFHHRMEYILQHCGEKLKKLVQMWDLTSTDEFEMKINELTEGSILAAFATYPCQIDFFLVHGVTGNHAVRTVFPHLNEIQQRKLLCFNLLGLLTDYIVQNKPRVDTDFVVKYQPKVKKENQDINWEYIVRTAVERNEEHIPKVVRSIMYYMEMVLVSKRSALFSDEFCKNCAFKGIDILKDIDDYIFE